MNWTDAQQAAALTEGWGIFYVVEEGRPVKTAVPFILAIDERFPHRFAATQHVFNVAKLRSVLHIQALQVCAAAKVKTK